MVTQSSSKEIWRRRPWLVMVTHSSSKEDLEKKVMVSEGSVVQQTQFQKKATMVIQSSIRHI